MARKKRFNLIGIPQHVIQRGNNREPCFYQRDDYSRYLNILEKTAVKFDCKIHAYVLMTNHVHLLVTPMDEHSVSEMMQSLGSQYVRFFNKKHNRTGSLWEGRFKSSLVDSDAYLFTCMRYIELNPVRANMVKHPAEYPWSSYAVNAQGIKNAVKEKHPVYLSLNSNEKLRLKSYRDLFKQHIDEDVIDDIRSSLNHELVLGRSYFKDRIDEITLRQTRKGKVGRPKVEDERGVYIVNY
ncbi:MAG: transposase [endosymbiont of Galathealinum brachiosum]|uniref:Transposase n=1 Tax=endosymbiont of Galathealinum brachiosum TaxID=2200906 RepID=A0A370DH53_9GAMM|nr:MAG: transposase [endosymbiont of Galathealinum brachiosum]